MVNKGIKSQIEALSRDKQTNIVRGKYKEVAEVCNYLGELLLQDGRYEAAISEHETELEMCEKIDDALGKAIANRKIGECYCALEDFDKALEFQQEHLSIARSVGDELEQQRAHATLGRTYMLKAEATDDVRDTLNKAQQAFNSSLSLASVLRDGRISPSESSEMFGRLYLNLGIISEMSGKYSTAIKYLQDAQREITGKKLDDDEQRCLVTLSGLYQKTGNCDSARKFGDMAYSIAKRTKNRSAVLDCLMLRAGIYLESEKLMDARHCLKKLLQSKALESEYKSKAIRMLKVVSYAQDSLLKLKNNSDRIKQLKLLEKLADGFCEVDCYYSGLRCYKKLLDLSRSVKKSAADLIPIYVSLAQTCADLKMYQEAIRYSMEEVKLREDPEQRCRTWMNIADYTYRSEDDDIITAEIYDKAVMEAEKAKTPTLLLQCLRDQRTVFQAIGDADKTMELEDRIRRLSAQIDAADDGEPEEPGSAKSRSTSPEIEDLSSVTESEDEKLNEDDSDGKKGRIRAPYKLRRNDKGESPLHIAVISGNYKRVKNLIAHGHPTNERDNCGWLPIHEAANHNHLEIATFLIEHNAWLNDKGLEGCGGMTPILDAASAGNLEMVRLLFDRGADVTCRDNDGKSLIDALSDWRRENLETAGGTSDADAELKFQDLVADLQAAMIEAGVKRTDLRAPVRKRRGSENRVALNLIDQNQPENSGDFVSLHKTPKFSVDVDLYEHELLGVRPASPHLDSNPAEIYRNAITNMGSAAGRKRKRTPSPKKVNTAVKTSALVRAEDYVGDDWLIWDVVDEVETKLNKDAACFVSGGNFRNSASKSRKTVAVDDIMACTVPLPGSTESAVSSSSGSKGKVPLIHRNKSRAARLPPVLILNDGGAVESEADILDMPEDEVTEEDVLPANNLAVKQTSARSGTLRPSPASVIISVDRSHSGGEDYRQVVRRLRVRIQDVVVLVPMLAASDKTISWLSEEAAARYAEIKGLKPVLQLKNRDEAILSAPDRVADVLGTDDQEITGLAISWNLPSMTERYAKSCQNTKAPYFRNIASNLTHASESGILSFANSYIEPAYSGSVLRTLQFQCNLREISLEAVAVGDSGFQILLDALPTLPALTHLNLSCTDLTVASLESLKQSLFPATVGGQKPLQCLTNFDIGHNEFYDASLPIIADIVSELPKLEILNLCDVGFTEAFLASANRCAFRDALRKQPSLRFLSFAMNEMNSEGVIALLSLLPTSVKSLNLSKTITEPDSLARLLEGSGLTLHATLEELSLAECRLNHRALQSIIPVLSRMGLTSLDVSGNPLGADGFNYLLDHIVTGEAPYQRLNISGIADATFPVLKTVLQSCSFLKELVVTLNSEVARSQLTSFWIQLHGAAAQAIFDTATATVSLFA